MQPFMFNNLIKFPVNARSLRRSTLHKYFAILLSSYSPLIAVIPGSFFPSIYSSIAPPPVET
jgi:hypothetical protein